MAEEGDERHQHNDCSLCVVDLVAGNQLGMCKYC